MAGIKEISKITGLSLATVSRVFNDSSLVSPKTREKVLKAAETIDYRPNMMAASLRSGKSQIIGVIVPEVNNYFFSGIINGIEQVVSDSGYNIIISQSHESQEKENDALNSFLKLQVDGILVSISKETTDFSQLQKILDSNVPLVFFDRVPNLPDISAVTLNDYKGGFMATEHLLREKCKNLIHIAGDPKVSIFQERHKGFLDAIEQSGSKVAHDTIQLSSDVEKDRELLRKTFESNPTIDGIFAYGDEIGLHVLNLLKELDIDVPGSVRMVAFGNANFSNLTQPKISTIDQECSQMGELAANLLLKNLKNSNSSAETKVLSPRLITRESSRKVQT